MGFPFHLSAADWCAGPHGEDREDPHEEGQDGGQQEAPPLPLPATYNIHTPPLKKVQEPKNVSKLLTWFFGVIYQADQYFGGPGNRLLGNFCTVAKISGEIG